jgi:xylulokinase
MQLLADVLQVRCVRMEVDEGPAFGAAILAGVGIGVWPDLETATHGTVRTGREFLPASDVYNDLYQHFTAISDRCRRSL